MRKKSFSPGDLLIYDHAPWLLQDEGKVDDEFALCIREYDETLDKEEVCRVYGNSRASLSFDAFKKSLVMILTEQGDVRFVSPTYLERA